MKFIKYINDPIYGGIPITKTELKLIDTPIFQRLRNISQLGKVNHVFPGAEHSRFVHSLGVLYIMGEMVNHLLSINSKLFTEKDAETMRIAALLHDIGHYPLSHLGEVAYSWVRKNEVGKSSESTFLKKELDVDETFFPYQFASFHGNEAHHEHLGAQIINKNPTIRKILEDDGFDPHEIGCIIQGKTANDEGKEFIEPVFCQLLHSSFDADRLDYLLRDSYQSGNLYGLVDFRYLIRCLLIHKSEGKRYLFFNKKAQHVSEHFLMSRYFHYAQVIHHKTNAAFEGVIKCLYINMLYNNKKDSFIDFPSSMEEILEWAESKEEKFCKFDDNFLFAALEKCNTKTSDTLYKNIYTFFKNNARPKIVFETKIIYNYDVEIEKSEQKKRCYAIRRLFENEASKISNILGTKLWGYQILPITIEGVTHRREAKSDLKSPYNKKALMEAIKLLDIKHKKKNDVRYTYLSINTESIIKPITKSKTYFIRLYIYDNNKLKTLKSADITRVNQKMEDLIAKEIKDPALALDD